MFYGMVPQKGGLCMNRTVLQDWVQDISFMQQTVLLTAIRGPDGLPKYHGVKFLLRWYRRCVLISAFDKSVLTTPGNPSGGSFTGPSYTMKDGDDPMAWEGPMDDVVTDYLKSLDAVPHHFQMHLMHAAEIVGYKHPDPKIAAWWKATYERLVHDMHLWPETEAQLDSRLGDTREGWMARGDVATMN
jgi:hypothetical protein